MPYEEVKFRLLTVADLDVFDHIEEGVFDHPVQRSLAEQYLSLPNNHIVVALAGDVVVGMASAIVYAHPDKPLQLFINEVGVADRMQRRGIGTQLVERLLELARTTGCAEVWVATEESNSTAREFYASLRGKEADERAVVYTWGVAESDDGGVANGSHAAASGPRGRT